MSWSNDLTWLSLSAAMRLPHRVQRAASGGRGIGADGTAVAPDLALLLRILELSPSPGWGDLTPDEARRQFSNQGELLRGWASVACRTEDLLVPAGDEQLRARLYLGTSNEQPRALMVYFHGGAMLVGDLDSEDYALRLIATRTEVAILSVEYSLAPEHQFPVAVHEALAVTQWAQTACTGWGVEPGRVIVGGASAGATLAAVTAQRWPESALAPLAGQVLIYPSVDRCTETESRRLFAEGFLLDQKEMASAANHYLPEDVRLDNPWLSPGLASDLSSVPPTLIATCGADPLRDEGVAYVERLRAQGCPVMHVELGDQVHGFMNLASVVPSCRDGVLAVSDAVAQLVAV